MPEPVEFRVISNLGDVLRDMDRIQAKSRELQATAGAASGAAASGFAAGMAKMDAASSTLRASGGQLTRSVTLPIVAIGGAALKAAIDFESSFAGIVKTTDATKAEFEALDKAITAMSERIPVSTSQLNAIGEMGGALGIPIEGMEKFIETVAILGATTDVSMEEGASAIAQMSNIMGTSTDDVDRFAATLVALGNDGASTEGQILEMSKRIAGAGAVVGLSEAEVVGFAAGLANMGIEAESGGSQISKAFTNAYASITSGTKESRKELEVWASTAGMSADEFKTAFQDDAAGAMTAFITGLGDVIDNGGDVIGILDAVGLGGIQAQRAFLSAASGGDSFTDAIDIATTAWEENSAAQDEADIRFATTESQLKIMGIEFANVARELGDALIPFLKEFVGFLKESVLPAIKSVVEWFTNLSPAGKRMVVTGVALVAALGPLLLILGGLLGTVSAIIKPFMLLAPLFGKNAAGVSKIGGVVTKLGGAFKWLGGIIRVAVVGAFNLILAHPIIAAIAAIIAIVILLVKNWDTVGPFFEKIWAWVVDVFWKAWEWIKNIVGEAWDWIKNLFFNFHPVGILIKNWGAVTDFFGNLWETVKGLFGRAIEFLKMLFLNFTPIGLIINHWSTITGFFAGLWETVKGIVSGAIAFLKGVFLNFTPLGLIIQHWSTITGFFSTLWAGVKGTVSGAIAEIKGVLNGIQATINSVKGWFTGLWNSIKNTFTNIVTTIKNKVQAAKDWLNKLNPFAKSSPSLVEQVESGVAKIGQSYGSLSDTVVEGPRVETTVKAVGTPDAVNLPWVEGAGNAVDVNLVGIDKKLLPIPVTGGGGSGGGSGDGGLIDEDVVADAVSAGVGGGGGGGGGSLVAGVRNLDDAISNLEDEAFMATLDPADRKFFQDERSGKRPIRGGRGGGSGRSAMPKRISGGGSRIPPNLFSPELARAQAAAGVPITRLPIAKPPSELDDKLLRQQIIVNNPVAKETEESVRSIVTKNTYLGANGVPKKAAPKIIKKTNTITTQSSGGGGTLKPL